jgi:hypothetical protein
MRPRRWTKIYFGVTHLEDVPRNIVATVTKWESGAEASITDLQKPNPFTGGTQEWFPGVGGFEQAKAQVEHWTKEYAK